MSGITGRSIKKWWCYVDLMGIEWGCSSDLYRAYRLSQFSETSHWTLAARHLRWKPQFCDMKAWHFLRSASQSIGGGSTTFGSRQWQNMQKSKSAEGFGKGPARHGSHFATHSPWPIPGQFWHGSSRVRSWHQAVDFYRNGVVVNMSHALLASVSFFPGWFCVLWLLVF